MGGKSLSFAHLSLFFFPPLHFRQEKTRNGVKGWPRKEQQKIEELRPACSWQLLTTIFTFFVTFSTFADVPFLPSSTPESIKLQS